jgi:hypothetical protein
MFIHTTVAALCWNEIEAYMPSDMHSPLHWFIVEEQGNKAKYPCVEYYKGTCFLCRDVKRCINKAVIQYSILDTSEFIVHKLLIKCFEK